MGSVARSKKREMSSFFVRMTAERLTITTFQLPTSRKTKATGVIQTAEQFQCELGACRRAIRRFDQDAILFF